MMTCNYYYYLFLNKKNLLINILIKLPILSNQKDKNYNFILIIIN